MTTGGICFAKSPHPPLTCDKGTKAAIVVKIPKVTGTATSFVPRTEASSGSIPVCNFAKTFSPVTIASSTTTPSTIINPKRLITLAVMG